MTHCVHQAPFLRRHNRWQDKRLRQLKNLANMRAAKARLRQERGAAGLLDREPEIERFYPLEFGLRDKLNGVTVWMDLKSLRDMTRRVGMVLRHYEPGGPAGGPERRERGSEGVGK